MSEAVFVLLLLNLAYIGLLPKIFFKRGKLHLLWWMTAAPFFICAAVLIGVYSGLLHPWHILPEAVSESIAAILSAISIALISFTLGTHRSKLALWHQSEAPESIVTYGAYKHIRHPFYTAFLLTLLGAFIFALHPATAAIFVYAFCILNYTARKEEKWLTESTFGEEYRAYRKRTGRFLPWFM
jgi:protein-S-isoprenylcysteine O-methyltransferase Ste14